MIDIKLLRNATEDVITNLARRGYTLDIAQFDALEKKRRELQEQTQYLQNVRNKSSKAIGIAKSKGEDIRDTLKEVASLGDQLKALETELNAVQADIKRFCLDIPNLLDPSVPNGKSETDNLTLTTWGDIPHFDFTPKDHVSLGEINQGMNFSEAAKLSGSRFTVLHGQIAKLHRALAQFMLDVHTKMHGYEEVYVPYLVKDDCLFGTGQLPKFAEDSFAIEGDWNLRLIPTAEVPITNLVRESIIEEAALPLKFTAHTPCFRSEAGSYGKDTRGMIRQHQFDKVELVQIVTPETSDAALDTLINHAESILQQLNLPYRKVLLCAGDTGFSAAKTYDLEVWLPGQDAYREISSCSVTRDFQARRMQARFKRKQANKPELVHTLNGSGLAVGRTLVAVMENYQQADGSVAIPDVLKPYF